MFEFSYSKFCLVSALVFILLVLTGLLTACSSVKPIDTNLELLDKKLAKVFELGSLAPSGHNTQMWKVSLSEELNLVKVGLDRSLGLAIVDPNFREAWISLGSYIRALELAFNAYGYETNTRISADGAEIFYKKLNDRFTDNRSISLMNKRHTEKRPFTDMLPDEKDILCLKERFKNATFISANDKIFSEVRADVRNAVVRQCMNKDAVSELSKWLRLSDFEANNYKNGLNAEQLGLSGLKKYAFYLITTHETVKGRMFEHQSIRIATSEVNSSGMFVTLQSDDDSEKSLISCGMELYDLMLALTEKNLSMQPMSAVLEDQLSREVLAEKLNAAKKIQIIMRIGYVSGDYGLNNRFRRDLKSYISVLE